MRATAALTAIVLALLLSSPASAVRAASGDITTIAGGFIGDGGLAVEAFLNSPRDVAVDGDGNFYVADHNNHRVRRVSASTGEIITVAGTGIRGFTGDGGPAVDARLSSPRGLAIDASGHLLIADTLNDRIRKVDLGSGIITTIAGGGSSLGDGGLATAAKLSLPEDVTTDGVGNLFIADLLHHRVRRVDNATGIIETIVGNGTGGFSGDSGPAVDASLFFPRGVAVAANGDIFVSDSSNSRIRKVDQATGTITTLAVVGSPQGIELDSAGDVVVSTFGSRVESVDGSTGVVTTLVGTVTLGFAGDSGPASTALINRPQGVGVDGSGNIYIADTGNNRVRKVDATTNIISTVAGSGEGDGSLATNAQFSAPHGIDVDGSGNLFVVDSGNNRVRKIDGTSGIITAFAGTGVTTPIGDGGPATDAALNNPQDVAVSAGGDVFIADTFNGRVRRVDGSTGVIETVAGGGVGGDGLPAVDAQLNSPFAIALDADGNLYIADFGNRRVRKVTADGDGEVNGSAGDIITTVAGTGVSGFAGDEGQATDALLSSPRSLAVDAAGNLYILDSGNGRVRKVDQSTGVITTVAGGGAGGDGGLATAASLNIFFGALTVDAVGNLFIAESSGHRIRRVDATTGIITTVAGTGTAGLSGDGGPAIAATLQDPQGLTVDASGNLFIADTSNNRVRKGEAVAAVPATPAPTPVPGMTVWGLIGLALLLAFAIAATRRNGRGLRA